MKTLRKTIFQQAQDRYGTVPEYLWKEYPNCAVLRRADNRKWYALLMDVTKDKLGLPGTEKVDVLNVKCDPILAGSLRMNPGFFPGYHMNHDKWLTILLDGTVPAETIFPLLELSYDLAGVKLKKRKLT